MLFRNISGGTTTQMPPNLIVVDGGGQFTLILDTDSWTFPTFAMWEIQVSTSPDGFTYGGWTYAHTVSSTATAYNYTNIDYTKYYQFRYLVRARSGFSPYSNPTIAGKSRIERPHIIEDSSFIQYPYEPVLQFIGSAVVFDDVVNATTVVTVGPTIEDSTGTALPSEPNLQFTGSGGSTVTVTDDSGDARTIVNIDSTASGGGGSLVPTDLKNTDYTASAGEFVLVDLSSNNVQITLPDITTVPDQTRVGVKVVSVSSLPFSCTVLPWEDNFDEYNYWGADPFITFTSLFKGAIFQLIKPGEFGDPTWIITTAEDPVPDPLPFPPRQDFVHTTGVCNCVSVNEGEQPNGFFWGNNGSPATIGKGTLPDGGNQHQSFITPASTATAINGIAAKSFLSGDSDLRVYYTYEDSSGSTSRLGRAVKSDGSSPTNLVAGSGLGTMTAVALWPTEGHVFWVNPSSSEIGRANVDGTSPNLSFISNTDTGDGNIYGLDVAFDPFASAFFIYWSWQDGTNSYVGRANIDGTSPNSTFITISGLRDFGRGLYVDGNYIYITYQEEGIRRYAMDGSSYDDIGLILNGAVGVGVAQSLSGPGIPGIIQQIILWTNSFEGTLVGKIEQYLNYDLQTSGLGRGLLSYGPSSAF